MVLHSLVDRMVVYPFFLLYGITIGLREKEKDIPFIPEKKEKKKKKKNKTTKKEKPESTKKISKKK
ncbi:MAG: hypothetical protein LBH96_01015 [Candidatus Peribacteria bacterium]|jgi:hypothetical protein|nr:hypothetical protein [Candidatus Peribacteria bacterium]